MRLLAAASRPLVALGTRSNYAAADVYGKGLDVAPRWVDIPRRFPGKCAVSGHSKAADGPYLEGPEVIYPRAGGLLGVREVKGVVYLSRAAVEQALRRKGSPLVPLSRDQHKAIIDMEREAREAEATAREEAEELRARMAELESENAELRARLAERTRDIADAVAERLGVAA